MIHRFMTIVSVALEFQGLRGTESSDAANLDGEGQLHPEAG